MIWDPKNRYQRSRVRALVAARWRAQRRLEQKDGDGGDKKEAGGEKSGAQPDKEPNARARTLADLGLGVIGLLLFLLLIAFIVAI